MYSLLLIKIMKWTFRAPVQCLLVNSEVRMITHKKSCTISALFLPEALYCPALLSALCVHRCGWSEGGESTAMSRSFWCPRCRVFQQKRQKQITNKQWCRRKKRESDPDTAMDGKRSWIYLLGLFPYTQKVKMYRELFCAQGKTPLSLGLR